MKITAKPLPEVELPPLRVVGKPLRRVDALGKAVGSTVYSGDYTMPKMLHAKVFRSSEPSARIKRLDVSQARALPGVVSVLTAGDLPDAKLVTDMPGQTGQKRRAGSEPDPAPDMAAEQERGEPHERGRVDQQEARRDLEVERAGEMRRHRREGAGDDRNRLRDPAGSL